MQNILGIIDSSGNLVVKYNCDAWGNHSACNPDGRVNNSETFIGNINPFRYDSMGHFAISLTLLDLIIGAVSLTTAGGDVAYDIAKKVELKVESLQGGCY